MAVHVMWGISEGATRRERAHLMTRGRRGPLHVATCGAGAWSKPRRVTMDELVRGTSKACAACVRIEAAVLVFEKERGRLARRAALRPWGE